MVTLQVCLQAQEGIVNPAKWFEMATTLNRVSQQLLSSLVAIGDKLANFDANCQTYVDAYQEVFGERFGLTAVAGHFGLPIITQEGHRHYPHAWMTSASAPTWVVDVSPFNGFSSPLIVNAVLPPWRGLYRPILGLRLDQTEQQERTRNFLAAVLQKIVSNRQLE